MPDEASASGLIDGVPPDAPGSREIIPDRNNASAILFDNLMGSGYRVAVTGPAGLRTYAELATDAYAFGAGLLSLRLRRGDRVQLFLDDTPAYPAAIFSAIRAGLVPLLINTLIPPDLLQFYLADSGAAVAICDRAFIERFNGEACRDTKLQAVVVANGEGAPPGLLRVLSGAERLGGRQVALRRRMRAAMTWRSTSASHWHDCSIRFPTGVTDKPLFLNGAEGQHV